VAISKNGLLYLTDDYNRVVAFTKSGEYQFQFGGGSQAEEGQMLYPNGIAIDNDGFVYVADYLNQRVQKFSKDGKFVKKWGEVGIKDGKFGEPGYLGVVFGIAIDRKGFIYTTDFETRGDPKWARVQKFNSDGDFILKFGEFGTGDGKFIWPAGIATDKNGRVYVVDAANDYVQVFSEDGRFIKRFGQFGHGKGEFSSPRGIVVDDEGFIYITDGMEEYDGGNQITRIQKFTNDCVFVKEIPLSTSMTYMMPGMFGMVIDKFGFLYVCDTRENVVKQFTKEGQLLKTLENFRYNQFESVGRPSGIAISPDNLLYVSEMDPLVNKISAYTLPYANAGLVDVKAEKEIPDEFSLSQNYPNPFNPNTVIKYQLSTESLVTLKIYDVLGREVETLVNEIKQGGKYEVRFDGSNKASGVYFYRIEAAPLSSKVKGFVQTKKFILLK
jgi:DNA-binding beta-propeller fold protein YncE